MYKLIVAGTRTFNNYKMLSEKLDALIGSFHQDITIVSGHAHGVDSLGERYAKEHNMSVLVFPADWAKYGKSAGPIRNKLMAECATHCVVFWDGKSKGAESMITLALHNDVRTYVFNY